MAHRTFNQSQRPASRRSADISGTGTRSRPPAKLRTIEETAELFNTSTRTVRRLIDAGALPVHRLGRCLRISDLDIVVFLAANRSI
jgi:excisionase family DNA binding protein